MYDFIKLSFELDVGDELTSDELEILKNNTKYKLNSICKNFQCVRSGGVFMERDTVCLYYSVPRNNTSKLIKLFKKPLNIKTVRYYFDDSNKSSCCGLFVFGLNNKNEREWVTEEKKYSVHISLDFYQ